MASGNIQQRRPPKGYQGKKKQRWPTRIVIALVSVGAMLGLWQIVANEPAASAHSTPSVQDAEQQLQLGAPNNGNGNGNGNGIFQNNPNTSPPNIGSGVS